MLIRTKFDGYSVDGLRRLHKGGGGGSAKYDNLEDLYKVQADSAKMLYDQANQYLPGATASYMDSVNEVLGEGYVEDQANKATADAASASAKQQDATSRNLASMGVNPNDPRFSASLRASGVDSAAKSAAMTNVARGQAKALQKATAQDAVGTFTGQSNSASSQLSGATSGMSNMFNAQAQQKAQQSAAEGEAVGNTVGAGLALMMKDGGRVQCARGIKALKNGGEARSIERHFLGGQTGGAQRGFLGAAPQSPQTQYSQPSQGQGFGGGVMRGAQMGKTIGSAGKSIAGKYQAASAGADMSAAQTKAASDAYNAAATAAKTPAEAAKYKDAATWLERGNSAFGASEGAAAGTAEAAGTTAAADAAGSAAATGATEAAGTAAATGAAEAAGTTAAAGAAEAAAGAAAVEGAAAGAAGAAGATGAAGAGAAGAAGAGAAAGGLGAAGAALGAAMPWVGAAMVAGSLLGVFADGGEVSDFREEGGRVDGPGSHTDDLVPALLSDEEHVMNGEAAAMVGHDKLEALNKQGLALRKKGYTLGQIKAGAGIKRRVA